MYQRLRFGADANAYIRWKLCNRELLWFFLANLPIEKGEVVAYLPVNVDPATLPFFAFHLFTREMLENDAIDYEYLDKERRMLFECLRLDGRMAVFWGGRVVLGGTQRRVEHEDVLTCTKPIPRRTSPGDDFTVGTEIYYVIRNTISYEAFDYDMSSVVERRPRIGAITSLGSGATLPVDRVLDEACLRAMAEHTEVIMMGAYEEDVHLIWTRS